MRGFPSTKSLGVALCLGGISAVLSSVLFTASASGVTPILWLNSGRGQVGAGTLPLLIQSNRAPAQHVGAVMAILGTFNEAGVLPPEADPRANQLIRVLIQFQSVFLKSQEAAVQEYFSSALMARWGSEGTTVRDSFHANGWTSKSLEAVVDYSKTHALWQDERMQEVFRQYYLSAADWVLVQEVFHAARQWFVAESKDIHEVFGNQLNRMARGEF